ncbi:hypothetical protein JANAI62_20960 [Jannaschia pagri]|uniref:Flagellar assembly protein FliH n=1 Tax=Jannaschia pagri TaxID=2829797 RepID=A0ABQ4NM30_9RHOB|nr:MULTISPECIES: hypothetical protein [unclassified Jannaschia]GIT91639.1 hypothetical protein JANAI61_20970 [Jannaschia sp. AI_61]GIT95473.1 hypothetical protein JANAI62_20960 [Jannaschia sp. AI_62]
MTRIILEDFGQSARPAPVHETVTQDVPDAGFDEAYNAGWDDAMAQVDAEQGRVSEKLRERLLLLERDQQAAVASAISALEPLLHDVFDKLLPRAAERSFIPLLLEEVEQVLADGAGHLVILVAPEEAASLARLLERSDLSPDQVSVKSEPALSLSQALVRWDDQERRIDLEAALSALDQALETFLASVEMDPSDG